MFVFFAVPCLVSRASAVFHGFLRGYLKADRFVRLIDHWRGAIQNNLVSKVSKFIWKECGCRYLCLNDSNLFRLSAFYIQGVIDYEPQSYQARSFRTQAMSKFKLGHTKRRSMREFCFVFKVTRPKNVIVHHYNVLTLHHTSWEKVIIDIPLNQNWKVRQTEIRTPRIHYE